MSALVCPVPECDLQAGLESGFASHLRDDHHLYTIEEVAAHLDMAPENVSSSYKRDFALRRPWWHNQEVMDAFAIHLESKQDSGIEKEPRDHGHVSLSTVLNSPYDFRQHQIAQARYKSYTGEDLSQPLFPSNDENSHVTNIIKRLKLREQDEDVAADTTIDRIYEQIQQDCEVVKQQCIHRGQGEMPDILALSNIDELQAVHKQLESKLLTAHKINEILANLLAVDIAERRRLFILNQCLLDANVEVGLPPEKTLAKQRVARDELDAELLT